jgi:hypothetical protein
LDEAKNAMKQALTIEEPQVQEPIQIPDNSKRPIIQKVKNIFKGKKGKSGESKPGEKDEKRK